MHDSGVASRAQANTAGPPAAPALAVTVLEAVRESRHVIKSRCSCQAAGSEQYVIFSSQWSGELDVAPGSRLVLRSWRALEVPALQLPLLLCFEASKDTSGAA